MANRTPTPLLDACRAADNAGDRSIEVDAHGVTLERRELQTDNFEQGGALASSRLDTRAPWPVRRPRGVIERLGVEVITDLAGTDGLALPAQRTKSGMVWCDLRRDADPAQTAQGYGGDVMEPKFATGWIDVSRQWRLQASPSAEAFLRAELRASALEALTHVMLQGDGATEPLGLDTTPDVTALAAADGGNLARNEVVNAVGECTKRHVSREDVVCVTTPEIATAARKQELGMDSGRYLAEGDMLARTCRYEETAHCPANVSFFGDWADAVVGVWEQRVWADKFTNSRAGTVRLICHLAAAVVFRRRAAFVRLAA